MQGTLFLFYVILRSAKAAASNFNVELPTVGSGDS